MEILISKLPDEKVVRELALQLNHSDPEYAFGVIKKILENDSRAIRMAGLKLATKVIRDVPHFLMLLDGGLARKDVSDIQFYLSAIASAIGFNRMLKHLTELAKTHPDWLVYAWYQLVPIVREAENKKLKELKNIELMVDNCLISQPQDLKDFWERTKAAVNY